MAGTFGHLHTMLRVGDPDRSVTFYSDMFAMVEREQVRPRYRLRPPRIGMRDVCAACERLRKAGAKIIREPGPVKFGTTAIAFVADLDGDKIELIQRS